MSDLADSFWERVNTLIKSKKTKQQDVAEACGLSYQTFRGWITRSTYPDALQTVKIAKCLGTSVEYLVTGMQPELSKQDVLNYLQNHLT